MFGCSFGTRKRLLPFSFSSFAFFLGKIVRLVDGQSVFCQREGYVFFLTFPQFAMVAGDRPFSPRGRALRGWQFSFLRPHRSRKRRYFFLMIPRSYIGTPK